MIDLIEAGVMLGVAICLTPAVIHIARRPPPASDAELTHAWAEAEHAVRNARAYETAYVELCRKLDETNIRAVTAVDTLRQIVSMETPGANATVRRIVQAARAGLPA